jgi:hypothetical protein
LFAMVMAGHFYLLVEPGSCPGVDLQLKNRLGLIECWSGQSRAGNDGGSRAGVLNSEF